MFVLMNVAWILDQIVWLNLPIFREDCISYRFLFKTHVSVFQFTIFRVFFIPFSFDKYIYPLLEYLFYFLKRGEWTRDKVRN